MAEVGRAEAQDGGDVKSIRSLAAVGGLPSCVRFDATAVQKQSGGKPPNPAVGRGLSSAWKRTLSGLTGSHAAADDHVAPRPIRSPYANEISI